MYVLMSTSPTLWRAERGISPVLGVTLLVAISVLLSAVVASAFLGTQPPAKPPTAAFDVTVADGKITIEHTNGESIDAEQLAIVYDGSASDWDTIGSVSSGEISAGDSATLSADATGTLSLRWAASDKSQSHILYSSFVAPSSAVSVTGVTFESGYSGWSDQHLNDQGYSPEGHFREIHKEGELQFRDVDTAPLVTDQTSLSQASSGTTRPFTLTYDGSTFTYTVDGTTLTTSAIQVEENAIAVMAKNRHSSVGTVEVENIQLNGNPVGTDLDVSTADKAESIIIEADGIENGFELTGDVTYTSSGTPSSEGEAIGIRVDIA